MISKDEVKQRLTGPISSIRTPFAKDGAVDFGALRTLIDFCIDAGTKTVLLTAGDSHYTCLNDREIAEVTKVACEQTAGRAMVVAADRDYSTARAIELAEYVRDVGADVLMCRPPDWALSCTPETLAEHYAAVAAHVPVMIVTNVFRPPRGPEFGLKTIGLALDMSDNVVAVKDDVIGDFARRLCMQVAGRCATFSGGLKVNHMNVVPYGVDGYLSTFITFKPSVTWEYWGAVESGDLAAACRIIKQVDMPFFDYIGALPGGFDAGIHGVMELFGITKRWRRKPYYSLNDEQMERLGDFLKRLGVL